MEMARVKSIESLQRGVRLLQMLRHSGPASLQSLHDRSGLPKASLLRILKTLAICAEVQRRAEDGRWAPTVEKPGAGHRNRAGRAKTKAPAAPGFSAVIRAALTRLASTLPWPSDVAVRQDSKMVVIDSNRSAYGRSWKRSVTGMEVDLLDSAMGRAWLAHCADTERIELVDRLLPVGSPKHRKRESVMRELALTGERGYALRDPHYAGPDADHDDQLSSFAVPVLSGPGVVACVSCVWSVAAQPCSAVIERCLTHVVREAAWIERQLEA